MNSYQLLHLHWLPQQENIASQAWKGAWHVCSAQWSSIQTQKWCTHQPFCCFNSTIWHTSDALCVNHALHIYQDLVELWHICNVESQRQAHISRSVVSSLWVTSSAWSHWPASFPRLSTRFILISCIIDCHEEPLKPMLSNCTIYTCPAERRDTLNWIPDTFPECKYRRKSWRERECTTRPIHPDSSQCTAILSS